MRRASSLDAVEFPDCDDDKEVGGPHCVLQVSAGPRHAAAVCRGGALFAWGQEESGRLGHSRDPSENVVSPRRVHALRQQRVLEVQCGGQHTLCRVSGGAVYSWGEGWDGRLGHGDTRNSALPRRVVFFDTRRAVTLMAASNQCWAICRPKSHRLRYVSHAINFVGFVMSQCDAATAIQKVYRGKRARRASMETKHSRALGESKRALSESKRGRRHTSEAKHEARKGRSVVEGKHVRYK